ALVQIRAGARGNSARRALARPSRILWEQGTSAPLALALWPVHTVPLGRGDCHRRIRPRPVRSRRVGRTTRAGLEALDHATTVHGMAQVVRPTDFERPAHP